MIGEDDGPTRYNPYRQAHREYNHAKLIRPAWADAERSIEAVRSAARLKPVAHDRWRERGLSGCHQRQRPLKTPSCLCTWSLGTMLVASSLETKSSVTSTSFAPDTLAGKCTALSEKNFLSSERVEREA